MQGVLLVTWASLVRTLTSMHMRTHHKRTLYRTCTHAQVLARKHAHVHTRTHSTRAHTAHAHTHAHNTHTRADTHETLTRARPHTPPTNPNRLPHPKLPPVQLVPEDLVRRFPRRMLNIHPGLLPSFGGKGYYGERVHQAVIASGARWGRLGSSRAPSRPARLRRQSGCSRGPQRPRCPVTLLGANARPLALSTHDINQSPSPHRRFSGPTVHFVDVECDTGPILAHPTHALPC